MSLEKYTKGEIYYCKGIRFGLTTESMILDSILEQNLRIKTWIINNFNGILGKYYIDLYGLNLWKSNEKVMDIEWETHTYKW